jgi:hypothetical protein
MRYLLPSLLILCAVAAEDAPKLPPEAQAAVEKADKSIATIQADADGKITKVRQSLIVSLSKCQDSAMRKNELEVAMAIKGKIEELKNKLPDNTDLLGERQPPTVSIASINVFNTSGLKSIPYKATVKATSEYPTLEARNILDDSHISEWGSATSTGAIYLKLATPTQATTIHFIARRSMDDPIEEGKVIINKGIIVPFVNLITNQVLTVKFKSPTTIATVDFVITKGRNSPGLKMMIME